MSIGKPGNVGLSRVRYSRSGKQDLRMDHYMTETPAMRKQENLSPMVTYHIWGCLSERELLRQTRHFRSDCTAPGVLDPIAPLARPPPSTPLFSWVGEGSGRPLTKISVSKSYVMSGTCFENTLLRSGSYNRAAGTGRPIPARKRCVEFHP